MKPRAIQRNQLAEEPLPAPIERGRKRFEDSAWNVPLAALGHVSREAVIRLISVNPAD